MLTLSLEMSRHLSSLAPGFEGHWAWYSGYIFHHDTGEKELVGEPFLVCVKEKFDRHMGTRICPAWQVEDVLRNIYKIFPNRIDYNFCSEIARSLHCYGDTAYQKIEEYLWTILK